MNMSDYFGGNGRLVREYGGRGEGTCFSLTSSRSLTFASDISFITGEVELELHNTVSSSFRRCH